MGRPWWGSVPSPDNAMGTKIISDGLAGGPAGQGSSWSLLRLWSPLWFESWLRCWFEPRPGTSVCCGRGQTYQQTIENSNRNISI